MNTATVRRGVSACSLRLQHTVRSLGAGVLLAATLAAIALLLSAAVGGPAMVYALVLGFIARAASFGDDFEDGLNFSAKSLLRLGVGLLGAGITFQQVIALGPQTAGLAALGVAFTIVLGIACARTLGLGRDLGLLLGGAVAICGASAALAIASVLPKNDRTSANTLLAVVGVTALSTIAMVLYPFVAAMIGLQDRTAGIFLGTTIHDVAQVVGAGYMISDTAGETATIVKLFRVACLLPVVAIIAIWTGGPTQDTGRGLLRLFPWFLGLFVVLSALASLQLAPQSLMAMLSSTAKFLLLVAISALGVKTSPAALASMGIRPVLVLILTTLGLAALALLIITGFPGYFA